MKGKAAALVVAFVFAGLALFFYLNGVPLILCALVAVSGGISAARMAWRSR